MLTPEALIEKSEPPADFPLPESADWALPIHNSSQEVALKKTERDLKDLRLRLLATEEERDRLFNEKRDSVNALRKELAKSK